MPYCVACGKSIESWDSGYYARNQSCITCYSRYLDSLDREPCSFCGIRVKKDRLKTIRNKHACPNCYPAQKKIVDANSCLSCGRFMESWEKTHAVPGGGVLCEPCYKETVQKIPMAIKHSFKAPPREGAFSRIFKAFFSF